MPRPNTVNDLPKRKPTRLPDYDYSSTGAYFVTLCCADRRCLFGEVVGDRMSLNKAGQICDEAWLRIPDHFINVKLDEYVSMPNHLHGILSITGERARHASPLQASGAGQPMLGHVVAGFKSAVSRQIRKLAGYANAKIWQRNYYEHVIRNDVSLAEIREYIAGNPYKWKSDELNPRQHL